MTTENTSGAEEARVGEERRKALEEAAGIADALGDKDKNDMLVNEPASFAAGYEIAAQEIGSRIRALLTPTGGGLHEDKK